MIVLDASAAVCLLLNSPADRAARLRARLRGEELQAPHLIDIEVVHALRRMLLTGRVTDAGAEAALADLTQTELERHPHYPFLADVWRMRSNRTAYDAAYIALAEYLRAPLITLDARLARTPSPSPSRSSDRATGLKSCALEGAFTRAWISNGTPGLSAASQSTASLRLKPKEWPPASGVQFGQGRATRTVTA